jgi:hypothetical protein
VALRTVSQHDPELSGHPALGRPRPENGELADLLTERTRKQNQNSAPAGCADQSKTTGKMNPAEEPS